MQDKKLTHEELIHEMEQMRKRIVELEKSEIELKTVEAALRKTEEKYRNIYENATEGIFQTTPEGRFLSANPSLAHIHGYNSPQELINTVTDIGNQMYVNPKDRLELIDKLGRYGFVQNFEVEMYHKDRSLQWISINMKAIKDKTGRILYAEGTMEDITQRKMAEKALIESEERYRTAIEHSNDGVTIIQGNKHQYVNRRFVEMFEYDKPEEIVGKPITLVVHPDDHELVININRKRQAGKAVPSRYEFKGITKTGKLIHVEVSATSTTYRDQPVYLVYLRDITERMEAHETLIKSHKELESLNRAKTKAVNHISHELKTPLAVIQGNIRILKRKLQGISPDDNFQEIMGALERNLERLFDISKETDEIFHASQELEAPVLLDDLDLLLQHMENVSEIPPETKIHWKALKEWANQFLSKRTEQLQSIDLSPFVQSVLEKVKFAASHRHIQYRIDGANFLFIFIDPIVLREICEGLIKNAIENTPDGGNIRIVLEQQSDRIWLHVTDSGIGITEENQKYILDGLFHTKETEMYTSKRPYEFGAGGKGFELLRMKTYGRRFGFEITFDSKRCIYIPTDQDICPGDISLCQYCKTPEDCNNSGGTTFSVSFPINLKENSLPFSTAASLFMV